MYSIIPGFFIYQDNLETPLLHSLDNDMLKPAPHIDGIG